MNRLAWPPITGLKGLAVVACILSVEACSEGKSALPNGNSGAETGSVPPSVPPSAVAAAADARAGDAERDAAVGAPPSSDGGGVADLEFGGTASYMFASFTGDGPDGLHLAGSDNGIDWFTINKFESVYQQGTDLMRDPSIVLGPDGQYHMVWTTGWWEQNLAVAHSNDLIHWSEHALYVWADYAGPGSEESDGSAWPGDRLEEPVAANEWVRNTWAPEIFYDPATEEYVICWSSSIDSEEVFPATWSARGDHLNHRIYFVATRDFVTYSPRRIFYGPDDRVVIDAFVVQLGGGDYRMLIKDESDAGYGNLHVVESRAKLASWATMAADFWGPLSEMPFAGGAVPPDNRRGEGPGAILVKDRWYVYADYWMNNANRVWSTTDFARFVPEEDVQFPTHLRHGTWFAVPSGRLALLEAL